MTSDGTPIYGYPSWIADGEALAHLLDEIPPQGMTVAIELDGSNQSGERTTAHVDIESSVPLARSVAWLAPCLKSAPVTLNGDRILGNERWLAAKLLGVMEQAHHKAAEERYAKDT